MEQPGLRRRRWIVRGDPVVYAQYRSYTARASEVTFSPSGFRTHSWPCRKIRSASQDAVRVGHLRVFPQQAEEGSSHSVMPWTVAQLSPSRITSVP